MVSKKKQRAGKLIALDNMLRHQKRSKSGSVTFTGDQIDAASQVIEEVLALDHIVRANPEVAS